MLSLFWLAACEVAPDPIEFCEGEIAYDYEPHAEFDFTTFPDDFWTEPANTRTGLRVAMDPSVQTVFSTFPENYLEWFDFLSTLDGFGVSAGIVLQFTGALPAATLTQDDVFLAALTEDGPIFYQPQITYTDADSTLILKPREPLPSATKIVAGVYTDPDSASCLAPSAYLKELLDPEGRGVEHEWSGRFVEGVEAIGVERRQIAAMTVFTTQDAEYQSKQVAEIAAQNAQPLARVGECADGGTWRLCESTLEIMDFRAEDGLVPYGDVSGRGTYTLPVSTWLPPGEGPFPTIVCGHGLGGGRSQCQGIADEAAARGFALIGVDAVEHGDHPERTDSGIDLLDDLMIFAIRLSPPGINGLLLRDNFRQSAWDKLQLIEAIRLGPDLDGDGSPDLDPNHIGYAGVSLGGIMGAEPLALSPHLEAGLLIVGGGRVTQIIQDSPTFSILIDVMKPAYLDDGSVDRAFPMLQTMMDPGDPMTWAPHVQANRIDDSEAPDVMLMAAYLDEIVPNSTNDLLAQAFGAPGVGIETWPVDGVTFASGSVSGNGPGGGSLGYVQLATVHEAGVPATAEHDNLHESDEGLAAIGAFFTPKFYEGGHGVVTDPQAP